MISFHAMVGLRSHAFRCGSFVVHTTREELKAVYTLFVLIDYGPFEGITYDLAFWDRIPNKTFVPHWSVPSLMCCGVSARALFGSSPFSV